MKKEGIMKKSLSIMFLGIVLIAVFALAFMPSVAYASTGEETPQEELDFASKAEIWWEQNQGAVLGGISLVISAIVPIILQVFKNKIASSISGNNKEMKALVKMYKDNGEQLKEVLEVLKSKEKSVAFEEIKKDINEAEEKVVEVAKEVKENPKQVAEEVAEEVYERA